MKRRDFMKKGSAVVATSVVGSTLVASCGGGDTTAPDTTTGGTGAGTGANPAPTTPDPVATPAPVPDAPATTPAALVEQTFYITEGEHEMMDATGVGTIVPFRSFNVADVPDTINVPGKAIIVNQGDTVEITVVNRLQSVHNFTISRLVNDKNVVIADTGVIPAGETRLVSFTANVPGTYRYEDATIVNNMKINSMVGMHGGFAVMPLDANSGNPLNDQLTVGSRKFVQQLFWVFNDVDPNFNNAIINGTASSAFTPQYFTMNGLSGRPPAPLNGSPASSPGYADPTLDSMHDPRSMLVGALGDRALVRCINFGMAKHSMHIHANHFEWLTTDGDMVDGMMDADPVQTTKDVIPLNGKGGICDVIYPFDAPPDAWPIFNEATVQLAKDEGRKIAYPMHFHDEMTQSAKGGSYLFGLMTDVFYEPKA